MTVVPDGPQASGPAPADDASVTPPPLVDPGPAPDTAPAAVVAAMAPSTATPDRGWGATASQGLLLVRWIAAELVAQRIEGLAVVAWIVGALGLVCLGLSLPVDPGWPLIALGVLLVVIAVAGRLLIALASALIRRLALPRRARHLRQDSAAARGRLRDAVAEAGVPVSIGAAFRFLRALARGRRPHAGVASNLVELSRRLAGVAEVDRLRTSLAEAASAPPGRGVPRSPFRGAPRSPGRDR